MKSISVRQLRLRRTTVALAAAACCAVITLSGGPARAADVTVSSKQLPDLAAVPADMSACPQYNFCIWQNANYNLSTPGGFWRYDYFSNPHDQWIPVGPLANNQASSLYNHRDAATLIAQYQNPTPDQLQCVPANTAYSDLAGRTWPDNDSMNDSISMINLQGTGGC